MPESYDEDSIYAEHMEWIDHDEYAPWHGHSLLDIISFPKPPRAKPPEKPEREEQPNAR